LRQAELKQKAAEERAEEERKRRLVERQKRRSGGNMGANALRSEDSASRLNGFVSSIPTFSITPPRKKITSNTNAQPVQPDESPCRRHGRH
jgi:hypothetical protein